MDYIEKYYNKFNEDKRLKSRHGIVEFTTSMEYIKKHLNQIEFQNCEPLKILDVGAGTGAYTKSLAHLGYDVTAVEYVKKNLSVLKENCPNVPAYLGSATNLKKFKDCSFDAVILFGPMYHLHKAEEKIQALNEAKRVVKTGGIIFVAYLLSNYAIIRHGFMDNTILDEIKNGKVDECFNIHSTEEDLYSYVNLNQIEEINNLCNLSRLEIISPDGLTDYIRPYINKLSEDEFELYLNLVKKNAPDASMLGASSHVVDVLTKH